MLIIPRYKDTVKYTGIENSQSAEPYTIKIKEKSGDKQMLAS